MLDKSLPYLRTILKRPAGTPCPRPELPEGFAFVPFRPGDEVHWAAIETAAGEFPSVGDALDYYQKEYIPHGDTLTRRVFFLQSPRGERIGTATCWWGFTGGRRDPWMHWVAVKPSHQGRGLGKALVFHTMERFLALEGDRDIYLPTQTWSYTAVAIYKKAGFDYCLEAGAGGFENQTEQALPIIEAKLRR